MESDGKTLSVEELYSHALTLPLDQRYDYIVSHCADTAIRSDLLSKLLDATQTIMMPSAREVAASREAPAISPGTRLGRYRIQRPLGSGGMGYVYEAVDENLNNRPVAIKVLPVGRYDEVSRLRFRREAEAASALNHPNIVTVHEIGREGEIDYIAMERVSGRTLHHLLRARPLALRKAIHVATQIADALAAAHEAGIVHRDLKPSNVMVSERGLVKVLDFGLAKQVVGGDAEVELSRVGDVVGTVYYMSPEQAEGKLVDARSDIFTFGTVLYEMLSGKRPFQGDTVSAIRNAIVTAEPEPLRSLRPEVPKLLESVFAKCTRKQPFERWQSLSDVKLILQDLAAEPDPAPSENATALHATQATPQTPRRTWFTAAGAFVVGALMTMGVQRAWKTTPAPAARTALRMVTAEKGLATTPALSRDGALLAFASDRANQGNLDIWIQQIGGGEPMRLTVDAADESAPSFSPDGARVAFRSEKDGGGIYIVPAMGGDPVLIAPKGRNPRFSPDGKSLAYWEGREGSLVPGASTAFVVDFGGGAPRRLETGIAWAQYPVWSPDGASLIVYGMSGVTPNRAAVDWWIVPAAGGKAGPVGSQAIVQPLTSRNYFPNVLEWYSAEGGSKLLFAPDEGDNSNLWSIGLAAGGKLDGAPVRVTNGPGRQLVAALHRNREGMTRLAYADETVNYDIWRLPVHAGTGLAAGPPQAITDRLTADFSPSVSGDDKQAFFIATRLGTWSVVRKDLDSNRERVLLNSQEYIYNTRVAPRGSRLFFGNRRYELLAIPTTGGALEKLCSGCGSLTGVSLLGDRVLLEPIHDEHLMMFDVPSRKTIKLADRGEPDLILSGGQFSPDGNWVAFAAMNNRAQTSAVYAISISGPLPVPREQWIAIADAADLSRDPLFAPAGPFLYFTAERDGFRCLWARRLDPSTHRPQGDPFAVQHFHTARLALRNRAGSGNIIGLSAGGRDLVFGLTETTGNIWLEETRRVQ